MTGLRGALMVCGTGSDAGKSRLAAGLCRWLHRRGVAVAPFKAQNMALNSYVTPSGHEIGRAQGVQALAAGVDAEVDMNPILLKPTGERTSQVVVLGRPHPSGDLTPGVLGGTPNPDVLGGTPNPGGHFDAVAYHALKPALRHTVLEALGRLRNRFDVVVMEGAGSPAEINLLDGDLVNLWLADAVGAPAVLVGDIDRGGVFAALYGTVALLPDHLRRRVRGFVINKFRGDAALLGPGLAELEARTGVPTLGVVPFTAGLDLDAEDSLALPPAGHPGAVTPGTAGDHPTLDVAVVRLPRIANFTDFDALAVEPAVSVRYVDHPGALGDPDLAVIPGTKATVADLAWLRERGFARALARVTTLLGVCGGYQMLGRRITDPVESGSGQAVEGLGWLDADTVFEADKITRPRRGRALGAEVTGYQIHHGRTTGAGPWIHLDDRWGSHPEGARSPDGRVLGTTLHGLFEADGFRHCFLAEVAHRRGKTFTPSGVSFAARREAQLDRLADLVEAHLDLAAIEALIKEGR